MKKVGVIGSTGRLGRCLVDTLLADPDICILAGSRDPDRVMTPGTDPSGNRLQTCHLDVLDARQLHAFCGKADLVINCAGPSGVLLDLVLRAAADVGCPVLDPGGYDPVLVRLETWRKRASADTTTIMVGAGLFPGLSGIYPRHLAQSEATTPNRLDVFYAGTDAWAPSSAWDIIHSTSDFGANRPPSVFDNGKIRPVPFHRAFRTLDLGQPAGRVCGMLLYTEELGRLARQSGIREVHCHGANNGKWSSRVLTLVKLLGLNRTPRQISRSAMWLSRASVRDQRQGQQACFAIDCVATWADRQKQARIITGDTYLGTAAVLATAARMILANETIPPADGGPPIGMAHELLDPVRFLQRFRATGCVIMEHC